MNNYFPTVNTNFIMNVVYNAMIIIEHNYVV